MKRIILGIGSLTVVLALAFGATSVLAAGQSSSSNATVKVAGTSLGRILVDARGHSLYLFAKDKRGKSACSGSCARYWPALIVAKKPTAGAGVKASLLGWTKRSDGRWQATYNHHPLYSFVQDTKKGQTNGEELDDFGGEWYVVSPAGAKVEKPEASSGSSSPAPGGYGY